MTVPFTAEELAQELTRRAIDRLAASAGGDAPDEDAQADADAILAHLEEPAFSELLAEVNEGEDAE